MILRRKAYIRTLQAKTHQLSEKNTVPYSFPRKINAEALKKAGDKGWCKKRDNPERGRKQYWDDIASGKRIVKKEITPRGDGN